MSLDENARLTFHAWLRDHDLDADTADAILRVMAPYDWHQMATKADLDAATGLVEARMEGLGRRMDGLERRMDGLDTRMDGLDRRMEDGFREVRVELQGLRHEVRTVLLGLVGFMVTVFAAAIVAAMSVASV